MRNLAVGLVAIVALGCGGPRGGLADGGPEGPGDAPVERRDPDADSGAGDSVPAGDIGRRDSHPSGLDGGGDDGRPADIAAPPACCDEQTPCPLGLVCAIPARSGFAGAAARPPGEKVPPVAAAGVCVPPPGPGRCYGHAGCPDGTFCVDFVLCACAEPSCPAPPRLGHCEPLPSTCCRDAGDCPAEASCDTLGSAGGLGVCLPYPTFGETCWHAHECPLGHCTGYHICPCAAACAEPNRQGRCAPLAAGCCGSRSDCNAGADCVWDVFDDRGGRCLAPATPPSCWQSDGCPPGFACVGAQFCDCRDPGCGSQEAPGACSPVAAGCCADDGDCPADMLCAAAAWALGPRCEPRPAAGLCLDERQCAADEVCRGAALCGCGSPLCRAQPGVCGTE